MHQSPEPERAADAAMDENAGFGPLSEGAEALQERIAALEEQVVRERAELENQRKRWLREFEQARKFGAERLLGDLVPVLDSLEQGLKASEAATADGVDSLREGMAMTLQLLLKAASGHGLTAVDPQAQRFDPEFHQAMGMQPSAEIPADHVFAVMQKGYRLHERLLRPALVIVSQGQAG